MKIDRVDHLVLTVRDIQVSCEFYSQVLGMQIATFDNDRKALHFGAQKINLHQAGNEFEPKALSPTVGSGDLCFVTEAPLLQVIDHIQSQGVELLEGPVRRTGAMGPMESIYLRDPDGNLIEIASYLDDFV